MIVAEPAAVSSEEERPPTNTTQDDSLTRLLKAEDVASALRVDKDRVWALNREGKLPAVKLGGRTYRWRRERVERAIAELED
jgi:excisionase family DNA binding protein